MTNRESGRADPQKLESLASAALRKAGVPKADADTTAHIIVDADLRGVDSHGVAHLYSFYVQGVQKGRINAKPDLEIAHGSPTTASLDGDKGLGFVVGHRAMSEAIDMARKSGLGWVSVCNSTHYGAGAYYAMMALEHDMIGFSLTVGGNIVAGPGGKGRLVGANVLAVAAPGNRYGPFVLDMATSVVAGGKLEIAHRQGTKVPEGWVVDSEGRPITDPGVYFANSGAILPLGSTISHGAYKGFGLILLVDILAGLLSGDGGSLLHLKGGPSHAFGAFRIDAFPAGGEFKSLMDDMIEKVHAAPTVEGAGQMMYPGERENLIQQERSTKGVPLHPKVVEELEKMCKDLDLPWDIW
jgi:LDH2 family malate/lactate/ureidoglycolate dehydrogenase